MSPQVMDQPWYIVIEGAIGVGKTTLARMLRDQMNTGLILEVFEENPFLADFYKSRALYAFQTQMFFLLSRYRQQQQIPQYLRQGAIISDYMFAKDRLFAQLNLAGDEWDVYQQLHLALAEQTTPADLLIYLQADTDVLMGRIAQRDRPYERDMDREYIESVRLAYEHFFHSPQKQSVLIIDTNELNFVRRESDFQAVVERINSVLQEGMYQRTLPQFEPLQQEQAPGPLGRGSQISALQRLHVELDKTKGFNTDIYFNYLCLSEEMGELGSELAKLWREQDARVAQGETAVSALKMALNTQRPTLKSELADCMAYLLKLANYTGIDLEDAYLSKMRENQERDWSF